MSKYNFQLGEHKFISNGLRGFQVENSVAAFPTKSYGRIDGRNIKPGRGFGNQDEFDWW